jgi:glycosyltransferase involved in cell wall biosynthesis
MSVSWVGPFDEYTAEDDHGIDFRFYRRQAGRLGRLLHPRRAARVAGGLDDVDVYYAVEPDSGVVAARLARQKRARAVVSLHEEYHADMLGHWPLGPFRPLAGLAVRSLIARTAARCDLLVGVGTVRLAPYTGVPVPKMVVRSALPRGMAPRRTRPVLDPSNPDVCLMHGRLDSIRGTPAMLRAVGLARDSVDRTLRVVGLDGWPPGAPAREEMLQIARRTGAAASLDLRKTVPFDEMLRILGSCDIGLILYQRDFGVRCMPNRLFEYMAAGIPIIAPDYAIEVRDIVRGSDCGLLVDCENPAAIAEAIQQLCANPNEARRLGGNGRQAFEQRYNWEAEVAPLIEWIRGQSRTPEVRRSS